MTNFNKVAPDLTEASLMELFAAIKAEPISLRPTRLVISEEGLERAKQMAADDPELRRLMLAEFPQFEGII
jgi:hypothetical protein